jgi:hypothetical protein
VSTNFHVWCETCEEEGPMIRRGAGGTALDETASHLTDEQRRLQGEPRWDLIQDRWCQFLVDHEYHELHLFTERARPHPPPVPDVDQPGTVTHKVDPQGGGVALCCDRPLDTLPRTDRIAAKDFLVTCPGNPGPPSG